MELTYTKPYLLWFYLCFFLVFSPSF